MIAFVAGALIAAVPVRISVNDTPLAATAVERRGRVLVPFRSVFSALGATVVYHAAGHRITAQRRGARVTLSAGSRAATLNGFPVHLDVAPQVLADRVFVPIRFAAQALGARVTYDAPGRSIFIRDPRPALGMRPPAAVAQDTPAPSYPTSPPVPDVAGAHADATYQGFGFDLYVPAGYHDGLFLPGDRVRFVLLAPPPRHRVSARLRLG